MGAQRVTDSAYGLWALVAINTAIVVLFAFSFTRPKTKRDWASLGTFGAFMLALFTEMYGFPLTIYLLSGWLLNTYPGLDLWSHSSGHLLSDLYRWPYDSHVSPTHIVSYILIAWGFILVSNAWKVLLEARKTGTLATSGPYARIRHPQYVGFALVMLGFLFQWPTIVTLAMFPVLILVYWRLAIREEREVRERFGAEYDAYAARVPRFVPRKKSRPPGVIPNEHA